MINDIYKTVQYILNKNGRGILSPDRFMLYAKDAQLKILNNAIDEYRRQKRNSQAYASDESLVILEDVLDRFSLTTTLSRSVGGSVMAYHDLPDDYMAFGNAWLDDVEINKIESRMKSQISRNTFVTPSVSEPVCYIEGTKMYVLPTSIGIIQDNNVSVAYDEVELSYYRYPATPNWTYNTISGKSVFNISDSAYQDFELPESKYHDLIIDIAKQAGVHIRDAEVVQYTNNEEVKEYQKDNAS